MAVFVCLFDKIHSTHEYESLLLKLTKNKITFYQFMLNALLKFIIQSSAYSPSQTVPNVKTNVGVSNTGATIHVVNSNISTTANTIRHKSNYSTFIILCINKKKRITNMNKFNCGTLIIRCSSTTGSATASISATTATSHTTSECSINHG